MAFAIESRGGPGRVVVTVTGDVDLTTAPVLREHLTRALADDRDVVVDLGGVGFLDSTGLGVLVAAHHRAASRGTRLELARPQPIVRNALRLVQVDTVIPVRDSLDGATDARSG